MPLFFKNLDLLKKYDCFFLTYDEPEKEKRWEIIKRVIPHAQWVDGVEGFDAAHKVCAERAKSKRLTIIDGDNIFKDDRPSLVIPRNLAKSNFVLSYSSKNNINGLMYGNGGIKSWPKEVLLSCQTHEASLDEKGAVDFCFKVPYYQIPQAPTETIVNIDPYQAFRAGYREGVKMALKEGLVPSLNLENGENLKNILPSSNYFRLKVWLEVGRDVENGSWAILGARKGLLDLLQNPDQLEKIRNYKWFRHFWNEVRENVGENLEEKLTTLAARISPLLGEELKELGSKESFSFKTSMDNPKREGLMIPSLKEYHA